MSDLDDIKDVEEQLQEVLADIQKVLTNEIPNLQARAKTEKCEYVKNRINRSKQVLKSLNLELKGLAKEDAAPFEQKSKEYEIQISKFADDLTWASAAAARDDLLGGNRARNADEMTTRQLVDTAKNIQEQSKASTTRAQQALNHAIDVGNATSVKLKDQTEQLNRVDKNLDNLESNLKKADRQVRIFLRRMATDRVVMTLVCLVVLGIVGAVATYLVKGRVTEGKSTEESITDFIGGGAENGDVIADIFGAPAQ